MTEAEWLAASNPQPILEFLGDAASNRKLFLGPSRVVEALCNGYPQKTNGCWQRWRHSSKVWQFGRRFLLAKMPMPRSIMVMVGWHQACGALFPHLTHHSMQFR